MSYKKNQIINELNSLDLVSENYSKYLHSKLQKSKKDISNGNVLTIEEAIERMKAKYEDFNIE